eukprot:scaffold95757_cov67-Phaeocystis_antarctica.AAC.5
MCGARDVDESGPPSSTHLSHPPSSKAPYPMRRRRWADTATAHDAAGRRLSTLQWHGPSHWNDRAVGGVDWPARVSGRVPKRGRVRVDWRGGLAAARRCVVGRVRARRGGAAGQGGAACPGTTWPVGVGLDVFQRWQGRAAASRAHLRRCGSGALPSRAVVGLRRRCDLGGGRVKVMQLLDHTGGSLPNSSQRRLYLGRGLWLELGTGQMRQLHRRGELRSACIPGSRCSRLVDLRGGSHISFEEEAVRSFPNDLLLDDLLVAERVRQADWLQRCERPLLSLPLGPVASKRLGSWREAYRLGSIAP